MTTKHVVADEVLGKVTKRFWELLRRVMEGSVDPKRALYFLQLSLEGISEPHSDSKTYILECEWCYDHNHREYATISLEGCDSEIGFEQILDPSVSEDDVEFLLSLLKNVYDAQIPKHGGHKMLRVYQVLNGSFSNKHLSIDRNLDLHFVMKPLFDFDDEGKPISCSFE